MDAADFLNDEKDDGDEDGDEDDAVDDDDDDDDEVRLSLPSSPTMSCPTIVHFSLVSASVMAFSLLASILGSRYGIVIMVTKTLASM